MTELRNISKTRNFWAELITSDFCVAYTVSSSCSLELDTCRSEAASVRKKNMLTFNKVMVPEIAEPTSVHAALLYSNCLKCES